MRDCFQRKQVHESKKLSDLIVETDPTFSITDFQDEKMYIVT